MRQYVALTILSSQPVQKPGGGLGHPHHAHSGQAAAQNRTATHHQLFTQIQKKKYPASRHRRSVERAHALGQDIAARALVCYCYRRYIDFRRTTRKYFLLFSIPLAAALRVAVRLD